MKVECALGNESRDQVKTTSPGNITAQLSVAHCS